jgi:hypothetical protein
MRMDGRTDIEIGIEREIGMQIYRERKAGTLDR